MNSKREEKDEKEIQGDTKERILIAATALFAEKGFEGTSMRDISQNAQVNLASINYHFENKANLYVSVFARNFEWLNQGVARIALKGDLSAKELAYGIYLHFADNASELLNSFRIFLNGQIDIQGDVAIQCGGHFGPPGGEYLYQALKKDLPQIDNEVALKWAVATIFTQLVHAVILMNCSVIKKHTVPSDQYNLLLSPALKERNIHALVESIEDFLIKKSNYWDDLI